MIQIDTVCVYKIQYLNMCVQLASCHPQCHFNETSTISNDSTLSKGPGQQLLCQRCIFLMQYWLVNRDPYTGLNIILIELGSIIPYIIANNQLFLLNTAPMKSEGTIRNSTFLGQFLDWHDVTLVRPNFSTKVLCCLASMREKTLLITTPTSLPRYTPESEHGY